MLPVQFVVYELLRGFHFNPEVINQLYHSFENEGQSTGKHFYSRDYAAYIDRRQDYRHADPCGRYVRTGGRRADAAT